MEGCFLMVVSPEGPRKAAGGSPVEPRLRGSFGVDQFLMFENRRANQDMIKNAARLRFKHAARLRDLQVSGTIPSLQKHDVVRFVRRSPASYEHARRRRCGDAGQRGAQHRCKYRVESVLPMNEGDIQAQHGEQPRDQRAQQRETQVSIHAGSAWSEAGLVQTMTQSSSDAAHEMNVAIRLSMFRKETDAGRQARVSGAHASGGPTATRARAIRCASRAPRP